MSTYISTDDARALVALVDYIEGRFPKILRPEAAMLRSAHIPGRSVTGEPFTELKAGQFYRTRDECLAAARAAFDAYAADKAGTLFWRCQPELDEQTDFSEDKRGWRFYMRLLISDKPCPPSTSSTTPKTAS